MSDEIIANFSIEEPKRIEATFEISQGGGGTKDHNKLENRDLEDQHPISAITNLAETLGGKQDKLTEGQQSAVDSGINSTKVGNYDSHLSNTNNPHNVTKEQIGLGNVENTSAYLPLAGGAITTGQDLQGIPLKLINPAYGDNYGTFAFRIPGQYMQIYNTKAGFTYPSITIGYDNSVVLNKTAQVRKSNNVAYDIITTQDKAVANGIASLDANIKVPIEQIPDLSSIYLTSHQNIKKLNTDNSSGQSVNSSEDIAGSGTISLHKVSKTGSYNDLLDKPTIPTVNNNTITITQGGTTKGTFTLNQNSDTTIALDAGGGGGIGTTTFFKNNTGTTLDTQLTIGNDAMIFKNGLLLEPIEDYSVSGSVITFVTALVSTDKIAVRL